MSEVTFQEIQSQKETAKFKARIEKLEHEIKRLLAENTELKEQHERRRKKTKRYSKED